MNNNNNNDDEGGVTFDLILSQVKYETPVGTIRKGLCSNFLLDLKMNSMVTCCHRQINSLQQAVADAGRKPLVMIAAGSGIAPFRAVWQVRLDLFSQCLTDGQNVLNRPSLAIGKGILIFQAFFLYFDKQIII